MQDAALCILNFSLLFCDCFKDACLVSEFVCITSYKIPSVVHIRITFTLHDKERFKWLKIGYTVTKKTEMEGERTTSYIIIEMLREKLIELKIKDQHYQRSKYFGIV